MSRDSAAEENRLSALAGIRNAVDETKALRATIAALTIERDEAQRHALAELHDNERVCRERDEAKADLATQLATAHTEALKEAEGICDEKNAAMEAAGEYQHGYWDACNEIKAAIAALYKAEFPK